MMHCCIEKNFGRYCRFFCLSKPPCPIIIIYFSVCQLYFARRQAFSLVSQLIFRAPRQLLEALQVLEFEGQFPNESISILSVSMFVLTHKGCSALCTYFQVTLQHSSHPIPIPPKLFLCPRPKFLTKSQRSDNTQQPKSTSCSG